MAEATDSVHLAQLRTRLHCAAITIALQRAMNLTKHKLRAQGYKVNHFPHRELKARAEQYLAQHREELIAEARVTDRPSPGCAIGCLRRAASKEPWQPSGVVEFRSLALSSVRSPSTFGARAKNRSAGLLSPVAQRRCSISFSSRALPLLRMALSRRDAKSWPFMLVVAIAPSFGCRYCAASIAARILRLIGCRWSR
jgi:hypothetical protein